jgi:hypothetical protein
VIQKIKERLEFPLVQLKHRLHFRPGTSFTLF